MAAALLAMGGCTSPAPVPGAPTTHHTVTVTSAGAHVATLRRGERLQVRLSSTYWHFEAVSRPGVLAERGSARVVPRPHGCVPGQGCGIVEVTYLATGIGSVLVRAARTSCGEAMGCTPATAHYSLLVTVR